MKNVWFAKGLKFRCTKCGKCCTGFPGHVWISKKEIAVMSHYLKIDEKTFCKKFTRNINGYISLKENLPSYDCIFFKDNLCQIHHVRPFQCRLFPFWPQNLINKKEWEKAALFCEGINKEGKIFSKQEILKFLQDYSYNIVSPDNR